MRSPWSCPRVTALHSAWAAVTGVRGRLVIGVITRRWPLGPVRNVSHVFRVATYRLRATFGRRWSGYLAIVLLVGLLGGLAIGSIAAARRTQSVVPHLSGQHQPVRPDPSDRELAARDPRTAPAPT